MATTLGSGSIVQIDKDKTRARCRKWRLKVSTGKDPRTGKYGSKSRRFEGTYTQAKAALREFVEEVEGDKVQGRCSYTLKQYWTRRRNGRSGPTRYATWWLNSTRGRSTTAPTCSLYPWASGAARYAACPGAT